MDTNRKADPITDDEDSEVVISNSPSVVQTPDTKCQKLLLSTTPPNVDKDKNIGDKNGKGTSPGLKQDVKGL